MICDYIECTSCGPGHLASADGVMVLAELGYKSIVMYTEALGDTLLLVPPSAVVLTVEGLESASEYAGTNLICIGATDTSCSTGVDTISEN